MTLLTILPNKVFFRAIILDVVSSITWYEPLPVRTVRDPRVVHATSIQLREGSVNELLRWNFSLSKFVSLQVYLFFDGAYAALIDHGTTGFVGVYERFISRFNISWIPPSYATLIIFNVTTADKGTFRFEVWSYETKISLKVWKCDLKVTIVGMPISLCSVSKLNNEKFIMFTYYFHNSLITEVLIHFLYYRLIVQILFN